MTGALVRADDRRVEILAATKDGVFAACELPVPIHALAAGGRPSSVMH